MLLTARVPPPPAADARTDRQNTLVSTANVLHSVTAGIDDSLPWRWSRLPRVMHGTSAEDYLGGAKTAHDEALDRIVVSCVPCAVHAGISISEWQFCTHLRTQHEVEAACFLGTLMRQPAGTQTCLSNSTNLFEVTANPMMVILFA